MFRFFKAIKVVKFKTHLSYRRLFMLLSLNLLGTFFTHAESPAKTTQALRIIVLAPHIVEMMYDIGAGDLIIATTEHADYPESAKLIPRIGNYARIQIEKVVTLKADFVIAWKTGNPSDDLAKLKQLGVKIVYSDPKLLSDIAKEVRWLGKLTHKSKKAEQLAVAFETRLAKLQNQYRDKKALNVFYELWPRPLTTIANQAWPQQAIEVCGLSNPFYHTKGDYPQVGIEQVIVSAPELIIQPKSEGQKIPDRIKWNQWPKIPAVKSGFVLLPNADKLHRMTLRFIDELELLCKNVDKLRAKSKV